MFYWCIWPLIGKLNFHRYLILRFFPTREIRENLMHVKNMFYSIHEIEFFKWKFGNIVTLSDILL